MYSNTSLIVSQLTVCFICWGISLFLLLRMGDILLKDRSMKKEKAQIINEIYVRKRKKGKSFLYLYGYKFGGQHYAVTIHNGFERKTRKKERTIFIDPCFPQKIITGAQHLHHVFWFLIGVLLLPVPFLYAVI